MIELGEGRLVLEGSALDTAINQFSLVEPVAVTGDDKVVLTEIIRGTIGDLIAVLHDDPQNELVLGTGMLSYEGNKVINLHGLPGRQWLNVEPLLQAYERHVTLYFRRSTR